MMVRAMTEHKREHQILWCYKDVILGSNRFDFWNTICCSPSVILILTFFLSSIMEVVKLILH